MRSFAFVLFFFVSLVSLTAQNLLSQIDSRVDLGNQDFSGEYTIVQERPGQGTSSMKAAVFRRDREDKFLILLMEPTVDRGKGYLKIGDSLLLYDPSSRRFTTTSARDRFQNSNARTSDFFRTSLADDYSIESETTEQLGAYRTRVLTLVATNTQVSFPRMKIWVDENLLIRKTEDYSLSGQLLRTTAIPRYQQFGSSYVPTQLVILDVLAGNERTALSVARASVSPVPDLVFTQGYLERTSR
ncbi:MAG: outer membrane lipoprotein-sorting protein [Spirochaetales bacterium]|nr:outer membrane lipoprotein-sorting protein [Spirochaetales bacterium]